MKKIVFKLSLLYLFIFLFCSKIYSYDRELIVNEIKNTIESNQDITDTIKLFYTETLYEPYWQNNKSVCQYAEPRQGSRQTPSDNPDRLK